MNEQYTHIIKKQILEFVVPDESQASNIQPKLSVLLHQKLIPIIDQYLNRLSPNDETIKIEQLNLDLGKIDPKNLEISLVNQLEKALSIQFPELIIQAKAQIIAQEESHPKSIKPLEALKYYLEVGSLPWNLSVEGFQNFARQIQESLIPDASIYSNPLPRWLTNPVNANRLIRLLPDKILSQIIINKLEGRIGLSKLMNFEKQFAFHGSKVGFTYNQAKEIFWKAWLSLKIDYSDPSSTFWKATFTQFQQSLSLDSQSLIQILKESEWFPQPLNFPSIGFLQQEATFFNGDEWLSWFRYQKWYLLTPENRQLIANQLTSPGAPLIKEKLNPILLKQLSQLYKGTSLHTTLKQLQQIFKKQGQSVKTFESIVEVLASLYTISQQNNSLKDQPGSPILEEPYYIHNAGLVILWPYLNRFFQLLNLMEGAQFKDKKANYRAIALLQYLADGQAAFQEYQLILNKILCGLEPSSVFELEGPLTNEEEIEGDMLLQAIIANVPVLKNMSVEGFRGSFLLRSGLIKLRSGIWEVYPEKATYDIVLEQFPWSWKLIKLPWLEKPIEVKWAFR